MHELKHLLPPGDATRTARHLGMLIDGLWVRAGLLPEPLTSSIAIADIALDSRAFREKSLQRQGGTETI